jgi:hypothetical protein
MLLMFVMLLLVVGVHYVIGEAHYVVANCRCSSSHWFSPCSNNWRFNTILGLHYVVVGVHSILVGIDHVARGVHRVVSVHCVQLLSQVWSLLFNMLFFPFVLSITPILALSCKLEFHWRQKVNGCKVSTKTLVF